TEQLSFAQHQASAHGIRFESVSMDLSVLQARRKSVIESMSGGVKQFVQGRKIEHIQGHARLTAPGKIRVFQKDDARDIHTRYTLIATGSAPVSLPFLPLDGEHIVSSTEALAFHEVPESLIVVG